MLNQSKKVHDDVDYPNLWAFSILEYFVLWFKRKNIKLIPKLIELKYHKKINRYQILNFFFLHSLPFKLTKIDFWPPEEITFWTISKYLICIAEFILRISDVYFNIFAAYTSALALIMLAYETLFWMAADWRFLFVYSFNMRSELKNSLPLIKIFSM